MSQTSDIDDVRKELTKRVAKSDEPRSILRAPELRELFKKLASLPTSDRAKFGQEINSLKNELMGLVNEREDEAFEDDIKEIDITAPFDVNVPEEKKPRLLDTELGSAHPVSKELEVIKGIFVRMGFNVEESRQLDDEYHMFTSLNFPKDHPARDDYDTFMTEEGLILPAHTSTMQNRVLKQYDLPVRVVIPGRVFRNEDLDATHEHTFHQVEGVYVDKGITLGDMLGTIAAFLEEYFGQAIEYKTQPFFFPFVEPGLEFLIKKPEALKKPGEEESWMEIMGCGMIHPNVLKEAGIDPDKHSGFAWGMGVDRMVMIKYGIEDVRHFMSGNLEFLRQF